MKKIALLATGGTIASVPSHQGLVPGLTAQGIIDACQLNAIYEILPIDVFSMDSSNIQPEEWCQLAKEVKKALALCDGVVITHGTDTMAYSAAALSYLLYGLTKPVIFTGSQLPLLAPLSDAPSNLHHACAVAAQQVPGVYVVFHHKIIDGTRAVKTRTTSFNAFDSINAPLAGTIDSSGIHFDHPQQMQYDQNIVPVSDLDSRVFLLKVFPGTMPDIFDWIIHAKYKGVVLEAFGLGGLHYIRRNLVDKLKDLENHGIPVLVVTQCYYEKADLTIYEVGNQLLSKNIISGGDLTTEAAVTKMMWALAQKDPLPYLLASS
ncbi:MAG: asparaginase [Clostridiales bacterium]|nr:asparaginase [Clostridiales bacterium]